MRLHAELYIAQGIDATEPNSINQAINSVSSPNYYVVDVHGKFSEYAGNVVYGKTMDDITNFFNEFLFLFGYRDPHPNQTGQSIISQLHIDKFKLIN